MMFKQHFPFCSHRLFGNNFSKQGKDIMWKAVKTREKFGDYSELHVDLDDNGVTNMN